MFFITTQKILILSRLREYMKTLHWTLLFSFLAFFVQAEPLAVYLTWKKDPSHSMVVQWITGSEEEDAVLSFCKREGGAWEKREAQEKVLKEDLISLHRVELEGLEAGTDYLFRLGEGQKEYLFRTVPEELKEPLKFAISGDALYNGVLFRKMNEEMARHDPDFVIVGGDIAYTINNWKAYFKADTWEIQRWVRFFTEWERDFKGKEGRLIPIVPIVGNHDVKGGQNPLHEQVLFYEFFSFPTDGVVYRALDCGNYLSLILLDTGHISPIGGRQAEWLSSTLAQRERVPLKMVGYHIGAFPSSYDYAGKTPTKIRQAWVPLFEKYKVQVAFEHHNHCYKRTKPIKKTQVDAEGIIYLGDGSWGVPPRTPKKIKATWYLAEAKAVNAYFLVTINPSLKAEIQPLSNTGEAVDEILNLSP